MCGEVKCARVRFVVDITRVRARRGGESDRRSSHAGAIKTMHTNAIFSTGNLLACAFSQAVVVMFVTATAMNCAFSQLIYSRSCGEGAYSGTHDLTIVTKGALVSYNEVPTLLHMCGGGDLRRWLARK